MKGILPEETVKQLQGAKKAASVISFGKKAVGPALVGGGIALGGSLFGRQIGRRQR